MYPKYSRRTRIVGSLLGFVLFVGLARACAWPRDPPASEVRVEIEDRTERVSKIERELTPAEAVQAREGIAALVLADVSRSMWNAIIDTRFPLTISSQIVIAQRAVLNLVRQFDRHAKAHPEEPVLVGLFAFGGQRGSSLREVIPLSPPDPARAEQAFPGLADEDGSPIGNAMIAGTRALDRTGLTRRHLFVVTDGANTEGHGPDDVMAALMRRPEVERPSVYFVTFDEAASRFDAVRKAGGHLLTAGNAAELSATVEFVLTGKIVVERQ